MLNLSLLVWLTLCATLVAFWWHSDLVKNIALKRVDAHCKNLGLQLLDYTMVLKGVFPIRDESGSLCLRRTYRFEFSSTGEERYRGTVVMAGRRQQRIEMDPHVLPSQQQEP